MFKYLKKGNCVKNAEFWKNVQMLITVIAGFLPFLAVFFPQLQQLIDADIAAKLGLGIGGVIVYLTAATSNKVGL